MDVAHWFKSLHLGNERSIWIRTPRDPEETANLVVFLDGERYRDPAPYVDVGARLEELDRVLPNCLIVFVSQQSPDARWLESPCYPPFAEFINDELVSWLEDSHPTIRRSSHRVLVGLSYTGLAAAYVALQAAGRWTAVLSQSGSFWSNDEWLTARYGELVEPLPTRFYLDVGRLETQENVRHSEEVLQVASQVDAVRRFRDVLLATGHEVRLVEFDGGHDYAAWRETIPDALRWALTEG